MQTALAIKLWKDARWLLAGCMAVQIGFAMLRVWFVSQLDSSRFRQILELLPGDLQQWATVDFDWMVTHAGRISLGFQEPMVNFLLFAWCVARGSDAVAGEVDRGTMEWLMTQPIGRRRYLATHVGLTVVGVIAISMSHWVGIALGTVFFQGLVLEYPSIPLGISNWRLPLPFLEPTESFVPMWQLLDVRVLLPASVSFGSMGLMLAALTTLLSAFDRYRWRVIGIAVGFYVAESMIRVLATMVPELAVLNFFTIFAAFEPEKYVAIADLAPESAWCLWAGSLDPDVVGRAAKGLGPGGSILFFLITSIALYAAAFRTFEKRDLPAPM